ncbi:interferon-induced protein with tetratricopeptide repeats 5-like [Anabas testudineus]|uniref:interferon-induced protein with tetratricopeptide repeats 5-like n=1 Tax=Anabas testudineus TaxID=64144 RepID=UPI000E4598B4|nr:interferon-induced protein with tetratricopeptide repeats 5-like [Anabas testudineus]
MTDAGEDLYSRLQQLQSHFTWDLKKEDLELEQQDEDQELGQQRAVAHSCCFLAYVRYLQGRPEEAESILSQSEEKIRECYGEESDLRLIVTYGDLAWLKYHRGDYTQSQNFYKRVQDVLVKYPVDSSTDLHPEVYGEKAWTYLKLSKSYYSKAIDCFRRALKLQPDRYEWNKGYAIALYRTEEVLSIKRIERRQQGNREGDGEGDGGGDREGDGEGDGEAARDQQNHFPEPDPTDPADDQSAAHGERAEGTPQSPAEQ